MELITRKGLTDLFYTMFRKRPVLLFLLREKTYQLIFLEYMKLSRNCSTYIIMI